MCGNKVLTSFCFAPTIVKSQSLSPHAIFHQEPYWPAANHFVNLYWVEFIKAETRFHLETSLTRKPVLNFLGSDRNAPLAAINTNIFFLDDLGNKPLFDAFNLCVDRGLPFQVPGLARTALIERNGSLQITFLPSYGWFTIGGKVYPWRAPIGTHDQSGSNDIIVYGLSQVKFQYFTGIRQAKTVTPESVHVLCPAGATLLGVRLNQHRQPYIADLATDNLSLLDYFYIIALPVRYRYAVKIGSRISHLRVGSEAFAPGDNAVSVSFSLPRQAERLPETVRREFSGKPCNGLLSNSYRKSWSAVLTTRKKVVFFLVDAYPYTSGTAGLNVRELQALLTKKFCFTRCAICDGGQTSKLGLRLNRNTRIYGNLHYVDYSGDNPTRNGRRGRPVPTVLLAY